MLLRNFIRMLSSPNGHELPQAARDTRRARLDRAAKRGESISVNTDFEGLGESPSEMPAETARTIARSRRR